MLLQLARAVWRFGPLLLAVGASLGFLLQDWLDGQWRASLRPARCRILVARKEGRILVRRASARGEYPDHVARYQESTHLLLEVEGVGPKRMVRLVLKDRPAPPGPVVDCWASATWPEVSLYPGAEAADRQQESIILLLALLAWSFAWFLYRRKGNEGPPPLRPGSRYSK